MSGRQVKSHQQKTSLFIFLKKASPQTPFHSALSELERPE